MYQSPIETILKDVEIAFDKEVLKAVQKVGINVDAEELRKALVFDRGQYDKGYADGEWELFTLITSAYYGKQYYFLQDDGLVYSRASKKYMTEDAAITEFLNVIGE